MPDLKSIFQPIFNKKFAFYYLVTLAFLVTIFLIDINTIVGFIFRIILLCSSLYLIRNRKTEQIALGILAGLATILIASYFYKSWSTFFDIVEWDFLVFYIDGKACADGLALYDPASFSQQFIQRRNNPDRCNLSANYHAHACTHWLPESDHGQYCLENLCIKFPVN